MLREMFLLGFLAHILWGTIFAELMFTAFEPMAEITTSHKHSIADFVIDMSAINMYTA
jgi:hypothetical protein